jgi:hypothetical protein
MTETCSLWEINRTTENFLLQRQSMGLVYARNRMQTPKIKNKKDKQLCWQKLLIFQNPKSTRTKGFCNLLWWEPWLQLHNMRAVLRWAAQINGSSNICIGSPWLAGWLTDWTGRQMNKTNEITSANSDNLTWTWFSVPTDAITLVKNICYKIISTGWVSQAEIVT